MSSKNIFSPFPKVLLGLGIILGLGAFYVKVAPFAPTHVRPDDDKASKLKLQPGFAAEHLYSPSANGQGSWVSMCFDNKGRLIASDQYGGLYRLTIPAIGSGTKPTKIERLKVGTPGDTAGMGTAHGLLYAFNSLYVMVNNRVTKELPVHSGFYRMQDTNGDDQYDKITLLKELEGSGEHGPHSIVLSPDKKSLYVIAGNHTDAPPMDNYLLPKTWKQDNLFPLIKDPRGHANDRMAPGGWVANVQPDGSDWTLFSAGYRNAFDMAFNDTGDLFVYDADMEWDIGTPWYPPYAHLPRHQRQRVRLAHGKQQVVAGLARQPAARHQHRAGLAHQYALCEQRQVPGQVQEHAAGLRLEFRHRAFHSPEAQRLHLHRRPRGISVRRAAAADRRRHWSRRCAVLHDGWASPGIGLVSRSL